MKAIHTKEYFEKYREVLFKRYRKECDYDHQLSILLPDLSALPAEQRAKAETAVAKMTAEKIVAVAKKELLKKMHMIQDIKAGRASLGYINQQQEVRAIHDLVEGFEFSCFLLAEFKNKYGVG